MTANICNHLNDSRALRSCLILPPNAQPQAALFACGAGALLIDLRDAGSWSGALRLLAAAREAPESPRLFVRLGGFEEGEADRALAALRSAPPDGVFLDRAEGKADVQRLGAKLAVFEAEAGLDDGALSIVSFAAQSPAAIFALGDYRGASKRLRALALDGEERLLPEGARALARGLLLLGAAAAGVGALDGPCAAPGDVARLRQECADARAAGFAGKLATTPPEIAVIEEVFGAAPGAP